MLKIYPRENRMLVRILPEPTEEKTGGGVVLPNGVQDVKRAVIVAVGPDVNADANKATTEYMARHEKVQLAVGTCIFVQAYGAVRILYNGEEHLLMTSRDALAVINEVVDAGPVLEGI